MTIQLSIQYRLTNEKVIKLLSIKNNTELLDKNCKNNLF